MDSLNKQKADTDVADKQIDLQDRIIKMMNQGAPPVTEKDLKLNPDANAFS